MAWKLSKGRDAAEFKGQADPWTQEGYVLLLA